MSAYHTPLMQAFCYGMLQIGGMAAVAAERPVVEEDAAVSRRIDFELTFSNGDLVWLGDPASPAASFSVKPGARPIATDCCVTTSREHTGPYRRYYREARIVPDGDVLRVLAFTSKREKLIGTVDPDGRFTPNEFFRNHHDQLGAWPTEAAKLLYDPAENALYCEVDVPGPVITEAHDFLPLQLQDANGGGAPGKYSIEYRPPSKDDDVNLASIALVLGSGERVIEVAQATMPNRFQRADVQLGSFDNASGTYADDSDYRAAAPAVEVAPAVTLSVRGAFHKAIRSNAQDLIVDTTLPPTAPATVAKIDIDGQFDDWRNVSGVDDARGETVSYLDYVSDVDLLEFKVAHDDRRIYLYARVAGQVGRTHTDGGRSYLYAYLDVDRNPGTGFIPSRDDECYYGVDLGDDCEVQFEFVGNRFRKSFYGFCGLGGDANVLKQVVALGKSQYGRYDDRGVERADYKSEYIYRNGVTEITEDLKLGSSDSIHVAISPDGHEVEVSSTFDGFLQDSAGKPTVGLNQSIDAAVGMECDGKAYPGKTRWAADSTPAIRGYTLKPAEP